MEMEWLEELAALLPEGGLQAGEPMYRHTTFGVGGPADAMALVRRAEELAGVLSFCHGRGLPCAVVGKGSNLLVGDLGFRGVIIKLEGEFEEISREGSRLVAGGGASLSGLAEAAQAASLTGLEFAEGIPGSLGGAVLMNAGAYGGEMSTLVKRVESLDARGGFHVRNREQMAFGYRYSALKGSGEIITKVVLELAPGDATAIARQMAALAARRRERQPLDMPSAGSTFKRPEGHFAGELIMRCLEPGYAIGGAAISTKHCGFVVNTGGATAGDIRRLIEHIQQRVRERTGVWLEPEVIMLGEFSP